MIQIKKRIYKKLLGLNLYSAGTTIYYYIPKEILTEVLLEEEDNDSENDSENKIDVLSLDLSDIKKMCLRRSLLKRIFNKFLAGR